MSPQYGTSRRDFLRRSLVAGGLLASPGLIAACSKTEPGTGAETGGGGGTLDKIKEQKYITVGFANEQPYAYRDGDKLTGEAPAVHGEIFTAIGGIELRPQLFEFGALIPALNANRVDVVTAGMFIRPDRCAQAAFSNPEYVAPTALLVKKGNPGGLTDYASVKAKGSKLAVMNGAVEVDESKAAGIPAAKLQVVPDQQSGLDAIKSGRADAFALTSISLRALVKRDSGVEMAEPFKAVVDGKEQVGAGAAVFRKADKPLLDAFNAELKKLLDSGRWLELVQPFGFTDAEKPDPTMTAEKLCAG